MTWSILARDPATGANSINVIAPTVAAADQLATRLKALPQVNTAMTIDTFIPADQPAKLALIADVAKALDPVLTLEPRAAPSDADVVEALNLRAGDLGVAVPAVGGGRSRVFGSGGGVWHYRDANPGSLPGTTRSWRNL